jgi:hypothetical protein
MEHHTTDTSAIETVRLSYNVKFLVNHNVGLSTERSPSPSDTITRCAMLCYVMLCYDMLSYELIEMDQERA